LFEEQHGGRFSRRELEGRIQQCLLQFFRFAQSCRLAVDFQKRVNVVCLLRRLHARQQPLRIAIERLGLLHGGELERLIIARFSYMGKQRKFSSLIGGKHKQCIRDGDAVAVPQNALGDRQTIDQRAIAAS